MTSANNTTNNPPRDEDPRLFATVVPASSSPLDEPLDAIVEDNYPPLAEYPYGPHSPSGSQVPIRPEAATGLFAVFNYQPPAPAQYMVPRRFGMSAILGIMTALAILFGCFRLLNAEPVVYLFFGLQTLVICFAQMLNSKSPRLASSIAGAILVPLFIMPMFFMSGRSWDAWRLMMVCFSLSFAVPIGAFLGYLTGTCAAGIFLVMDYLEPYLQGHAFSSHSSPGSTAS